MAKKSSLHLNLKAYQRRMDRAIAEYTEALRFDPDDANVYNKRGEAYFGKSDYDKAIADYEAASRIDPNNAEYGMNLAFARAVQADRR
jgi:tetratricopeptide (TPR) repeat protein